MVSSYLQWPTSFTVTFQNKTKSYEEITVKNLKNIFDDDVPK